MCVPHAIGVAQMAINAAASISKTVIEYNQQEKNNEYRKQVAINNIKNANAEAQRQVQLGIDKSREEKIEGLKKASYLMTQNAASNFDVSSGSNFMNYQDIQNTSFSSAQDILDSYNYKADTYFNKANSYLNNYLYSQKAYKNSVLKSAITSLGNYSKVALSWYSNSGDNYYDSI